MIAGRLSLNYGKYMAGVSAALLTVKNLKPTELTPVNVSANVPDVAAKTSEEFVTDVSVATESAKTSEELK